MTTTLNKTNEVAIDTKLIAGLQKYQASLPGTLFLANQTLTAIQVVAALQSRINTINAADAAKAAWQAAVKTSDNTKATTSAVVVALKQQLVLWYSTTPEKL